MNTEYGVPNGALINFNKGEKGAYLEYTNFPSVFFWITHTALVFVLIPFKDQHLHSH
jgi:hypothetical protein